MEDHRCQECFASMFDHSERCYDDSHDPDELPVYHFPPTCCQGCPCGSWEEQHPVQCMAEVRRIKQHGPKPRYPGAYGSRRIHVYEYGRCTRTSIETVAMYPPRAIRNRMHTFNGRVCKQHSQRWNPRMADASIEDAQAYNRDDPLTR